jgi:hypothetical protein
MKHQSYEKLADVAKLYSGDVSHEPMSQHDRMRRWVELLVAQPKRILQTLDGTEYWPITMRDAMRSDNTVITVAFEDPRLRAAGLRGDTYGDAKRFFGLSDRQLHFVVCYCHSGLSMSAGTAARRLEVFIPKSGESGLFRRAIQALGFGR